MNDSKKDNEEPLSVFAENAPDWRIWFGLSVSIFWLIMLSVYVETTVGWDNIGRAPIETVGNFLEGAFAPLAFLWLVIGYFLQKKELMQNTEAIKMQHAEIQKSADQAVIQSEAIRGSEMHARKEAFLRIAESVRSQLGSTMGFLFLSSQGGSGSGQVSEEVISKLWNSTHQDPEVFSRRLLELSYMNGPDFRYKLFYGTPIRAKHTDNFIFNFERMLRAAEECDGDGMIRDSQLGSPNGFLYRRMIDIRNEPPPGFTPGEYDFDPDTFE